MLPFLPPDVALAEATPHVKKRSAPRTKRAKAPASSIIAAIREASRLADEAEVLSAREVPRLLEPPPNVPQGQHVIVWRPDKFTNAQRFLVVPTAYRRGMWVAHSLLAASPGNRIKPDFEDSFTVSEVRTGMAIHHAPTLAEASKLVRSLHAVSPDPFPEAQLGEEPSAPAPAPELLSAIYAAVEPYMLKERERHRKVIAGRAHSR